MLLILAIQIILGRGFTGTQTGAGDIGAVPIAFPLIAGPDAITTTIVSFETYGIVVTLVSIAIVTGVTWVILRNLDVIDSILGKRGAAALSTLMAVFIAAIAIQFILTGVQYYYPA